MIYENCKIYGPYIGKDNRLRCIIKFPNGDTKTISYPKLIMEYHLDRYLDVDETIDHIDGNPLNNNLENLQVLDRKEHAYNDAKRNKDVVVTCSFCGKNFVIKGSKLNTRNRKDRHSSGYFCSRKCSGKYGSFIQHGKIQPITVDKVIPNKYQVKSAIGENL